MFFCVCVCVCVCVGDDSKAEKTVVYATMPEQAFTRLVENGLCVFVHECFSVCVCVLCGLLFT